MFSQKKTLLTFLFSTAVFLVLIGQDVQDSLQYGKSYDLITILKVIETEHSISFVYEAKSLENITLQYSDSFKELSKADILDKIIDEVPVIFEQISEGNYVVRKNNNKAQISGFIKDASNIPLAGATIGILGYKSGTISDSNGSFNLELEGGNWQLEVRYVGYESVRKNINLAGGESVIMNFMLDQNSSFEEIVVVGSRSNPTTAYESASLVKIIDNRKNKNEFYSELSQLLQYENASFHSIPQTVADGSDHIDPATLRGLGPDQLLVLINGKRRHQSALVNINNTIGKGSVSTDLNVIPISAIDRIEILQDGDAAQYGSDAIAGIINIVLKGGFDTGEINAKGGVTNEGDGKTIDLSVNKGLSIGDKGGFINLSGQFFSREAVNRSGNYTGPIFNDIRDSLAENRIDFFERGGSFEFGDERVMNVGVSDLTFGGGFFNTEVPLSEQLKLYSFGGFSYKSGLSSGFYRFPYQTEFIGGGDPLGFAPKLNSDILNQSFSVGIKKVFSNWVLDFSNTYGKNSIDFIVKDSENASLGSGTPVEVKAGQVVYRQNTINLDLARSYKGDIPISVGIGSEFRLENYQQNGGEEASWRDYEMRFQDVPRAGGIQMFPGISPENVLSEHRNNLGLYMNVEIKPLEYWKMGGAARYERYSDFGDNISWKLYSRFQLSQNLIIRGSLTTGFRAPSLHQAFFTSQSNQFISATTGVENRRIFHFNQNSDVIQQLGLKSLEAEKSLNANLGLTFKTNSGTLFSLNAYQINIDDRIILTGRLNENIDQSIGTILSAVDVTDVQFFTNAIGTNTKGIELGFSHDFQFLNNPLNINVQANLNQTIVDESDDGSRLPNISSLLQPFEALIFNREEVARIESGQPNSKLIISASYQLDEFQFLLRTTRFGSVTQLNEFDGNSANWLVNEFTGNTETRDQNFSSKWITDLSIHYNLTPEIAINVGGSNILNVYPDTLNHSANTVDGVLVYSRDVIQFGLRGAYWYGNINFKF